MKEMVIILTVLISDILLEQDLLTKNLGTTSMNRLISLLLHKLGYISLGIRYISNKGFTFKVEITGITLKKISGGTNVWVQVNWVVNENAYNFFLFDGSGEVSPVINKKILAGVLVV